MSKFCPVCSNKYNLFDSLTNPDMCKACFGSEKQKALFYKIQSEKNTLDTKVEVNAINLKYELQELQKAHKHTQWSNLIVGIILITLVLSHETWDFANTIMKELDSAHLVATVLGITLIINTIKNWKSTPELDLAENAIRRAG